MQEKTDSEVDLFRSTAESKLSSLHTRIALYTRVSTRDKGQETANQLKQLREFCSSQGWVVVAEYEDHESGGNADRTQFKAMMTDAARRRFDVVLFWALDRFTREGALETLQHLNWLGSHGIAFRSFTEPYLDSCGIFKDAVIAILGTIAKQERVRISERVRAGLSRARSQGTRSGKPIGRPRAVFARDRVRELRAQGGSWRMIARTLGVSVASVRRACQRSTEVA
jgi:DNA invertase Pin-like site-specific DNA recombinase